MNVLDVINSPWAILPSRLLEIQRIYVDRSRGIAQDFAAIEAELGSPLNNQRQPYAVSNGVAVIELSGVIAKRMNLFTQISGGTSAELAAQDLRAALADSRVRSIVLAIDSPGGTVDGTQTLANQVFAARKSKPIVALASGVMASAAYWIGSAAQAVYVADATTVTGSIGILASHVDVSQAEASKGHKTTEVYAGKYKRIASSYAPLTDAGRQSIQDHVDYLYAIFVGDVAKYRGVSVEAVLARMADGKTFIGRQGFDAGLVDGMATLNELVARLGTAAK